MSEDMETQNMNPNKRRKSEHDNGTNLFQPIERPQSVFYITPDTLKSFEDLTQLPYLYEETVLDCLNARYNEDLIYTWAGPILVAINPFRPIEYLYDHEKIDEIHSILQGGNEHQDPHVFTVAGVAHNHLISQIGLGNQAILVSGESGSGKTESAKFLLTYLTQVESKHPSSPLKGNWEGKTPQDVQRRILASNPILEAFGNAATLRNYNSSRFGKLVRLQYSRTNLKGATTDTYLLEKTRVTSQPEEERNFHIFYQLLSGINNGLLPDFELNFDEAFLITPGYHRLRDSKDLESFKITLGAFYDMQIEKQNEIFKVLLAIIYLGNISFELEEKKDSYIVSNDEVSSRGITMASKLLGLSEDVLSEVLTIKKIIVGNPGKETIFNKVCERMEQCEERRDSMMQLIYSALFSYIVSAINSKTSAEQSLWSSHLGILDVYGFETFDQNSLEQLCINYANERLQQEFTRRYLASEHRILTEEGFLEFPLVYTDNARCVSVLDSSISVFAILNEECQLRRALNEDVTCERVCNALQNTGIIMPPSSVHQKTGFVVKHYAGPVNYASMGLLHKNKDEVPREIVGLMSQSKNKFVSNLTYKEEENDNLVRDSPTRKSTRKITTLSKFKSSLDTLMKILTSCDLHYIRCLKPNMNNIPAHIEASFLSNQLKANGILETVKISQAGYPIRMLYEDFERRYNFSQTNYNDKEITFVITLKVLGDDGTGAPSTEKCRFGRNRIFLSESSLHKLEKIRQLCFCNAATCIQKYVRMYLIRKRYKRMMSSVILLQRLFRVRMSRLKYLKMKEAAIRIQKNCRAWLCRKRLKEISNAVISVQKYVRGWLCRQKYKKMVLELTDAQRPVSRVSLTSAGYASCVAASLTDYSISDAETPSLNEGFIRLQEKSIKLFETEESGIETDTESLSGDGLKVGRACRVKSRRQLSHFARATGLGDLSDEDVTDFSSEAMSSLDSQVAMETNASGSEAYSHGLRACSMKSPKRNKGSLFGKCLRKPALLTKNELQFKKCLPTKNLQEALEVIKDSVHKDSLKVNLNSRNIPVFIKDGIMSYRQLPTTSIKFHTRRTCLPYSTSLPQRERPQGLIDAIR